MVINSIIVRISVIINISLLLCLPSDNDQICQVACAWEAGVGSTHAICKSKTEKRSVEKGGRSGFSTYI